jgi:hypothetical protein
MNAEIALPIEGQINEEHRLARSCADDAVHHPIRCGELLLEQKGRLEYGEFGAWIAERCEFSQASANLYMKAAKNPNAVGNSIRHLYPSGREPKQEQRRIVRVIDDDLQQNDEHHHDDAAEITAAEAVEMLKEDFRHSQLIRRYRGHKQSVGFLRNKLSRAEAELTAAEEELIRAAIKHRGTS